MHRIAVLGAGSWGTALSLLLAQKAYDVDLWVWDPEQADTMRKTRENPFLKGYELPSNISVHTSISSTVRNADAVVFVTVSHAAKDVAAQLKECLPSGIPIISATKGLDGDTGLTVSQTLNSIMMGKNPVAALSGPNLAFEVAKGVPTATVVACTDENVAREVQHLFVCPTLRVYTNTDVVGVELAGALKNVIAIAAGISDGLGFGDNTKAALITRGLAEITRLGMKIGAKQATFMGLAGVGDLMVTCASPLSRNHRVGVGIGQGRTLDNIMQEFGQVVAEGVPTTKAACALAQRHDTPMPITEQVYDILFRGKSPKDGVADLMCRMPREEVW